MFLYIISKTPAFPSELQNEPNLQFFVVSIERIP